MAAPLVFDYLARLNIAPQPERAAPRSVPLDAGLFCGTDGRLAATMQFL
jgi:hypothetical protein